MPAANTAEIMETPVRKAKNMKASVLLDSWLVAAGAEVLGSCSRPPPDAGPSSLSFGEEGGGATPT